MAGYDQHDAAVAARINDYIKRANVKLMKETVDFKLEWCWSQNIAARESSQRASVDTVGRDADYYFAARHVIAGDRNKLSKYADRIAGPVATIAYIGLKIADKTAQGMGAPPFMRSNSKLPNAPPGGLLWEERGANDGLLDNGQAIAPALLHSPKA